jgi:hypothetical protein
MARPGLFNNSKFRRVLMTLREPRAHVRGYLECLWDFAYETGDPVVGDAVDVELAAEFPGEQGRLFDALLSAGGDRPGFIEPVPGVAGIYQIHHLHENAPDYVKKRWKRHVERKNKELSVVSSAERQPLSATLRRFAPKHVTPVPDPIPFPKDKDKDKLLSTEASSTLAMPPTVLAPAKTLNSPVVLVFPTIAGKRNKDGEWELTQEYVDELAATFPAVGVNQQCREALTWVRETPTHRKTADGMRGFLRRWMKREQNKAGSRALLFPTGGSGGVRARVAAMYGSKPVNGEHHESA